jgi:hypothetical protein
MTGGCSNAVQSQLLEQRVIAVHARDWWWSANGRHRKSNSRRPKTQRLLGLAHLFPTGRQAHVAARHGDAGSGDGAHELEDINRIATRQGRAGDRHQIIDRHRFRGRIKAGQFRDQSGAVPARFTHADDAAATDLEPAGATPLQGVEPILVGVGGDHIAVILRGGIEIVVVVIQSGIFQLLGLTVLAECPV